MSCCMSLIGCLSLAISASDMERNCLESAISLVYPCLFLMDKQPFDPLNTRKTQPNPLLRDPLTQQPLWQRKSASLRWASHWASPIQASASSILDPYSTAKPHQKLSAQIYVTFQCQLRATLPYPDFGNWRAEEPAHLSWGQTTCGLHLSTSRSVSMLPSTSRLGQI